LIYQAVTFDQFNASLLN